MSVIAVEVIDARAVLDEETGVFSLQARLRNGQEVHFSSKPSAETLDALREALTSPVPEPVKPKRRRTKKTPSATEETL